jgi:hypothetical protein
MACVLFDVRFSSKKSRVAGNAPFQLIDRGVDEPATRYVFPVLLDTYAIACITCRFAHRLPRLAVSVPTKIGPPLAGSGPIDWFQNYETSSDHHSA